MAVERVVLQVRGLTRRFGDVTAIEDVSFDVPAGALVGFLGPNGSGKSTTMRAIVGVTEPDAGSVTWNGAAIDHAVRQRFGYMPEERGLYPKMGSAQQIAYFARLHGVGATEAAARATSWLEIFGLADRADDPVQDLSLGNQQRVQLAVGLVHEPDLLILDEPFSGLDPLAVGVMSEVLRKAAAEGTAVLFSSHQLELVEGLCESVVIVDDGHVVVSGEVRALKHDGLTRLRVGVDTSDPSWPGRVAGVQTMGTHDGLVVFALPDETRADEVLAAAQAAGRLTHFSVDEPTLNELFRDAVRRERGA